MGNKTSSELWTDIYRLQGKEMLGFDDEVAEKVTWNLSSTDVMSLIHYLIAD
jgi:hypothetical protein